MIGSRSNSIVIDLTKPSQQHEEHLLMLDKLAFSELGLTPGSVLPAGDYDIHNADKTRIIHKIALKHDVLCAGEINPEVVVEGSAKLLELFLQNSYVGKIFNSGLVGLVDADQGYPVKPYVLLTLKNTVAVRKNKYGAIVCDVIKNDELGRGASRTVRSISGSLKYRYEPHKQLKFELDRGQRVANIGVIDSREMRDKAAEIEKEAEMMRNCPHIAVRKPFFGRLSQSEGLSAISMRKFNGHDLIKWLKEDDVLRFNTDIRNSDAEKRQYTKANSSISVPAWTLDDRFELSIELLRKLHTQIHARGIVHRDIKPENIKVYKDDFGFHVNIFDLNLARLAAKQDRRPCGTPGFVAPEFDLNGTHELDEKSDVFSMGLVLALLWRDKYQQYICKLEYAYEIFGSRDNDYWVIHFDIGDGIIDLSETTKNALTELFSMMTKSDKDDRINLTAAIEKLEDIYLALKLQRIPAVYHKFVNDAVSIARQVRFELNRLGARAMNKYSLADLGNILKAKIEALADDSYAVREFVSAAGIVAFRGILMKSMLVEKTDEIIGNFTKAYDQVDQLRKKLSDLFRVVGSQNCLADEKAYRLRLVASQIAELSACAEKVTLSPLTLDSAAAESARLLKKAANIQRAIDGFEELKPARELLVSLNK